jgi:hypothetical protein
MTQHHGSITAASQHRGSTTQHQALTSPQVQHQSNGKTLTVDYAQLQLEDTWYVPLTASQSTMSAPHSIIITFRFNELQETLVCPAEPPRSGAGRAYCLPLGHRILAALSTNQWFS